MNVWDELIRNHRVEADAKNESWASTIRELLSTDDQEAEDMTKLEAWYLLADMLANLGAAGMADAVEALEMAMDALEHDGCRARAHYDGSYDAS